MVFSKKAEIESNRLAVDGEQFQQAGSDTIYLAEIFLRNILWGTHQFDLFGT